MQLARDQARGSSGHNSERRGIGSYVFKHNLGHGTTGKTSNELVLERKHIFCSIVQILIVLFRSLRS